MGKICYIMGKSASGKDSIFKELRRRLPEYRDIVLYTTRPIRAGETDGVEYHFVDEKKLRELENAGRVIEQRAYETVHGIWRYFTADDGQIDLQHHDYLMIGTLESYEKTRDYLGEKNMIPILIDLDDGVRLQRALDRERAQEVPQYGEMCRRFLADLKDFTEEKIEQAGVTRRFINDDLNECLEEIMEYIKENL